MFPAVAVKKADSLLLPGSGRLTPPVHGVASQFTTSAGRGREFDQFLGSENPERRSTPSGVKCRETRVSTALSARWPRLRRSQAKWGGGS